MAMKPRWTLSLLFALLPAAAFGDTVLSPATEVAGVRVDAEPGSRNAPAIASNGDRFLIAWNDLNAGKVLYSLLSNDGSLLTPVASVLGTVTKESSTRVSVASNGSDFVVVWASTHSTPVYSKKLFLGMIDAGGATRSVRELPMTDASEPQIAWNGSTFLLVYRAEGVPYERKAVLISSDGSITAGPIQIAVTGGDSSLAAANGFFLVAYEMYESNQPVLYGVVLDGSGRIVSLPLRLAPASSALTARIQELDVASNGQSFAVAWSETADNNAAAVIYGREISSNGSSADAPIVLATGALSMRSPALAWNGTRYILNYSENIPATPPAPLEAQLQSVALNSALRPAASPATVDIAARPIESGLDAAGSRTITAWLHVNPVADANNRTLASVYAATLDGSGRPATPVLMSRGAAQEESESVASTLHESLVVWDEHVESTQRHSVRAQLASRAGSDPLIVFDSSNEQTHPSIAASDSLFFIVWVEARAGGTQLSGMHFDESGRRLETEPIVISTDVSPDARPNAMWDGTRFAVAWENSAHRIDLAFSSNFANVFSVSPARDQSYHDRMPSIAFDGSTYVVVWSADQRSDCPFECNNDSDIRLVRVSLEGLLLDPEPLQVFGQLAEFAAPSILSNGREFVISWGARGMLARRMTSDGNFLDPIDGIVLTHESATVHDLFFDGETYTLALVAGDFWSVGITDKIRIKTFANLSDASADGFQSIDVAAKSVSLARSDRGSVRFAWTARIDSSPYLGATRVFTATAAVTPSRALPAPSDLVAQSVVGGVILRWMDNSQDETGFVIEHRDGGSSTFGAISETAANSSSFILRDLPLRWHFFQLRAIRGNEQSEASNVYSLLPIAQTRRHPVRR